MAHTGCALASLFLLLLPLPASAQWRVAVQEADGSAKEAAADGSLLACTTGAQGHVLQVIDPRAPAVLFTHPFPETVFAVAFAPDRRTLAVSTHGGVFRVSLADGQVEEILPGVAGLVAFDAAGKRLGVLGSVPGPKVKPAAPGRLARGAIALGVYDLQGKRWAHRTETPIVSGLRVAFAGDTLIGYGKGGDLYSMIPRWFFCDVQLDTATGKARTRTSDYRTYGGQKSKRIPGIIPGETGGEMDPNYQPPKAVAEALARTERLLAKADWRAVQKRLSSAPGDSRRPAHFAAVPLRDKVLFAVQRVVGDRYAPLRTAAVEITRDGGLRMYPSVEAAGRTARMGDLLVGTEGPRDEARVLDLTTGKTLLTLPEALEKKKGGGLTLHFSSQGLLVLNGNKLALYRPGSAEPAWERALSNWYYRGFRLSDDGRLLVTGSAHGTELALFVRMSDGKVVGSAPRPPEGTGRHLFVPVGLDPAGKRLAAHLDNRLAFFEVPSGRLVGKYPVKDHNYFHFLKGLRSGWLISGSYYTRLFDEAKGWGPEVVGFRYVTEAHDLDTPAGRRLLLRNSYGSACLADPATGKVLTRWVEADRSGRRAHGESEVAAGGRLLVRPLAWRGAVELVKLADAKVALTVHPLAGGKDIGWVAFTPDGRWDASPGAERYVAVVGARGLADGRARDARRDPASIRARLRALWGPAGK
jgi:hypothetical protein